MQEAWVWSLGQEDLLEKGMATHSRFLPAESHEQRSLVGYMGSQSIRRDWVTNTHTAHKLCVSSFQAPGGLLSVPSQNLTELGADC